MLKRSSNHDPKISKQRWSNYCFMTPSSMTLHPLRAIEFTNSSFSSLDNCFINGELGTLNQSVLHVITLYVYTLLPLTHTFFFQRLFPKWLPSWFFFLKKLLFSQWASALEEKHPRPSVICKWRPLWNISILFSSVCYHCFLFFFFFSLCIFI